MLCTNVFDSQVNQVLELVRGNVGEGFAGFADCLVKDAPADGFLNEFRNVALFHALGAQIGAQGMIGLFGPGNGQTGGCWLGRGMLRHISIYPLISISYYETCLAAQEWFIGGFNPLFPPPS